MSGFDAPELPELPTVIAESIASWRRTMAQAAPENVEGVLENAARDLFGSRKVLKTIYPAADAIVAVAIADALNDMAEACGIDPDTAQLIFTEAALFRVNGHGVATGGNDLANDTGDPRADVPPAENPAEFGKQPDIPQQPKPAILRRPSEWPTEPPPPVDWLASQRFPRGDVSGFVGDGGVGKTDAALQLAANVARGAPDWLGHEIASGPAVFISAEEPEREIMRRAWAHAKRGGYNLDRLTDLHFWFPDDASFDTLLAVPDRNEVMQPTPLFESIYSATVKVGPNAVFVDSVVATFAGNQNNRVMVRSCVNLFRKIARLPSKPAIVLLDHPSLSGLTNGTGRGGSMDWWNALRCVQYLSKPEEKADVDRGIRVLETKKSNYGPCGPATRLRLQWAAGGLELEKTGSPLHRLAKDQECDQIFLRLLDARNAQGSHVGRGTSGMYAPKEFANSLNNGGCTKQAFSAAMERLFAAGTIKEAWDSRRRHNYIERSAILAGAR